MAVTFRYAGRGRNLPLDVIVLGGYSRAGKDTLVLALGKMFRLRRLSAGEFNKRRLVELGVSPQVAYAHVPERVQPHLALPVNPATGERYSPIMYEAHVLQQRVGPLRTAKLNLRDVLLALANRKAGETVVLNGVRYPLQPLGLKHVLQARGYRVAYVRVESPQVPCPPPYARDDGKCDWSPLPDMVVWNDQRFQPGRMVGQVARAAGLGRRVKKRVRPRLKK